MNSRVRRQAWNPDYAVALMGGTLFLLGFGLVMVYSASYPVAMRNVGSEWFYFRRQLVAALIGLVGFAVALRFRVEWLRRGAYPLLLLSLLLLLAVMVVGTRVDGATRWLRFGPLSFQPSEFAKLGLLVWLARWMSDHRETIGEFRRGFLPPVLLTGLLLGLILWQRDLGTLVVLSLVLIAMLWEAGARLRYTLAGLPFLAGGFAYLVISAPYRLQRIQAFFDPWQHRDDIGYQLTQSLGAIAGGGIAGLGLGEGQASKLQYIPAAHTDFIFAVVGEELGLIGIALLVSAYMLIIFLGLRVASRVTDGFSRLLAFGIVVLLGVQCWINFGVTMGILPTKGLTLPLISYGGTSLIVFMILLGFLVQIASRKDLTT